MRHASLAGLLIALATPTAAQAPPIDPYPLIAQAQAHVRGPARDLWPGWDRTPFGIVLIDGEHEHLICDDRSPPGFSPPRPEPTTGCTRRSRPRRFPSNLLAAMPAFGPPSVIVVGAPAATGRSPAAWTATLVHEHFHQHQNGFPGYFDRVAALDLSGGDQTGMWMLNYAFPYEDRVVVDRFAAAGRALHAALVDRRPSPVRVRAYLAARQSLAAATPARDWRYADFQMWQEGVARYTEITAAELSSDAEVQEVGRSLRRSTMAELRNGQLARNQRVALYALGAGEAMLLEACGRDWKSRYARVLGMTPLVRALSTGCGG